MIVIEMRQRDNVRARGRVPRTIMKTRKNGYRQRKRIYIKRLSFEYVNTRNSSQKQKGFFFFFLINKSRFLIDRS